jgi:hypothetical protein
VHALVPLQDRVVHASLVQTTGAPPQWPAPSQWSPNVHAFASSHNCAGVAKVTVQAFVPLHVRVVQISLVQVIGVPLQAPAPSHVSPKVQAFLSLQAVPGAKLFASVHPPEPSHTRSAHSAVPHDAPGVGSQAQPSISQTGVPQAPHFGMILPHADISAERSCGTARSFARSGPHAATKAMRPSAPTMDVDPQTRRSPGPRTWKPIVRSGGVGRFIGAPMRIEGERRWSALH